MTGLEHIPTIVRLTLFEALRRRTLWALVVLTAVIVVLTGLGFEYLVTQARERGTGELRLQLGVSQVLILCAFMFSFILATTAAFLAAPAIAGDVESGVLLAMLARPLGRGDVRGRALDRAGDRRRGLRRGRRAPRDRGDAPCLGLRTARSRWLRSAPWPARGSSS